MDTTTLNCQMDIAFQHTPDGRPELYDFLWEHLPNLVSTLQEKKITIRIQPPETFSKWGKLVGMPTKEINHIIEKIQHDKRFDTKALFDPNARTPTLEMSVRTEELDHVLNAYNIVLERFLPYLTFEGKSIEIDFSPAEKNTIKCYSTSAQKPLINTFLVRNLTQVPRVRSIVFASRAERMRGR